MRVLCEILILLLVHLRSVLRASVVESIISSYRKSSNNCPSMKLLNLRKHFPHRLITLVPRSGRVLTVSILTYMDTSERCVCTMFGDAYRSRKYVGETISPIAVDGERFGRVEIYVKIPSEASPPSPAPSPPPSDTRIRARASGSKFCF